MAENQIVIGLDFSKTHLRVAGLVNKITERYIVIQGSKDVKADTEGVPGRGQLVAGYRDGREIVNSWMGGGDIQATFVVVPNATAPKNRDAIAFLGSRGGGTATPISSIVEAVSEYAAVAAAYASKLKPNKTKTLAVVSTTGCIIDVTVVSVEPKDLLNGIYDYNLEAQKTHQEAIDFDKLEADQKEKEKSKEFVSKLPKIVNNIADSLFGFSKEALDILRNILSSSELTEAPLVDAVAFVGNVSTPNSLLKVVRERYPDAKIWDDIDNDEVAAYGAAALAFAKTKTPTPTAN